MARVLAPVLARTPVVFGDTSKVKIAETARIVNALLNVQSGNILIKDFVFFGHNVCLLTGSHDLNFAGKQRIEGVIPDGRDIVIEKGVWLTSNVTVIGPCIIGENSVVLPGSVVNCDIPPNSVFGGVPARLVKTLEPDISTLSPIKDI